MLQLPLLVMLLLMSSVTVRIGACILSDRGSESTGSLVKTHYREARLLYCRAVDDASSEALGTYFSNCAVFLS